MIKSNKGECIQNNPYTLVFGKEPAQVIPRLIEKDEIMEAFYESSLPLFGDYIKRMH